MSRFVLRWVRFVPMLVPGEPIELEQAVLLWQGLVGRNAGWMPAKHLFSARQIEA